ncbi:hypothetical protein ACFQL4_01190 [Halosimplex aquaticum]
MTSGRHLVVLAGADAGVVDAMAATLREDGTVRTAYSPRPSTRPWTGKSTSSSSTATSVTDR